ncbi:MAG: rhodanese-like domain-containing protein [Methanobacteriales archaeon HGW-Methanobacteriales-1]|jgi:rhodanese-related sulfurtransferase|nr:MAG: rhodanese-like domain-containing protein [Methanobacteriales archaeon HGW-Methanobacteriales-1]
MVNNQIFKDITPQESSQIIKDNINNPEFFLLDVRTPAEFQSGHLEGAVNVDYQSNFKVEIEQMDKEKKYLLYCKSGIRSANALEIMRHFGFNEVYNMLGGITYWADEGRPVLR